MKTEKRKRPPLRRESSRHADGHPEANEKAQPRSLRTRPGRQQKVRVPHAPTPGENPAAADASGAKRRFRQRRGDARTRQPKTEKDPAAAMPTAHPTSEKGRSEKDRPGHAAESGGIGPTARAEPRPARRTGGRRPDGRFAQAALRAAYGRRPVVRTPRAPGKNRIFRSRRSEERK